jgi:hypothetical protein
MHPKTRNELTTIKLKFLLPNSLKLDVRLFFKLSGALTSKVPLKVCLTLDYLRSEWDETASNLLDRYPSLNYME